MARNIYIEMSVTELLLDQHLLATCKNMYAIIGIDLLYDHRFRGAGHRLRSVKSWQKVPTPHTIGSNKWPPGQAPMLGARANVSWPKSVKHHSNPFYQPCFLHPHDLLSFFDRLTTFWSSYFFGRSYDSRFSEWITNYRSLIISISLWIHNMFDSIPQREAITNTYIGTRNALYLLGLHCKTAM